MCTYYCHGLYAMTTHAPGLPGAASHVCVKWCTATACLSNALCRLQCHGHVQKEGRRLVACLFVESLNSYLFTRLTFINCFCEPCYVLQGHSIGQQQSCPVPFWCYRQSLAALGWGQHTGLHRLLERTTANNLYLPEKLIS